MLQMIYIMYIKPFDAKKKKYITFFNKYAT